MRIFVLGIICCVVASPAFSQDDTAALRRRIAELEKENRQLRGIVVMRAFTDKVKNGVRRDIPIEDGRGAKLVVAPDGWGSASPEDVAAVCVSCAETIFRAIRPNPGREPTIFVIRDKQGPMTVSQRGPNGEFFVLLSSGDRHWSQVAYQFSHELGHVLCGDLSLDMPQHWFEEAFCESLSLWTMDKMGVAWATKAPYENWKSYAPSLTKYINDVRNQTKSPASLAEWYQPNIAHLTRQPYDREKNRVIAKQLAIEAHKNPAFFQAFHYMRLGGAEKRENSMEWLLANWHSQCPGDLKFAPSTVAQMLDVKLKQ